MRNELDVLSTAAMIRILLPQTQDEGVICCRLSSRLNIEAVRNMPKIRSTVIIC